MSTKSAVSHTQSDYRHRATYRVRYADLDTYGHVNNKAFLSYVEDARVLYLLEAAGFTHSNDGTAGVMIVHASIDYLAQIHPYETVDVYTRTARIGGRSFTIHHLIIAYGSGPESHERVAATSTAIIASVDLDTGTSRDNDPAMTARIRAWEPLQPMEK